VGWAVRTHSMGGDHARGRQRRHCPLCLGTTRPTYERGTSRGTHGAMPSRSTFASFTPAERWPASWADAQSRASRQHRHWSGEWPGAGQGWVDADLPIFRAKAVRSPRIAPVPDPHERARLTADVRQRTVADETKAETVAGGQRDRPSCPPRRTSSTMTGTTGGRSPRGLCLARVPGANCGALAIAAEQTCLEPGGPLAPRPRRRGACRCTGRSDRKLSLSAGRLTWWLVAGLWPWCLSPVCTHDRIRSEGCDPSDRAVRQSTSTPV